MVLLPLPKGALCALVISLRPSASERGKATSPTPCTWRPGGAKGFTPDDSKEPLPLIASKWAIRLVFSLSILINKWECVLIGKGRECVHSKKLILWGYVCFGRRKQLRLFMGESPIKHFHNPQTPHNQHFKNRQFAPMQPNYPLFLSPCNQITRFRDAFTYRWPPMAPTFVPSFFTHKNSPKRRSAAR